MLSGAVTNRYTQGLFLFAREKDVLDSVDASLKTLADTLLAHPELQSLIDHPLIEAQQKVRALSEVFGDALDPSVKRFLEVLLHRGRGAYLTVIYERFHQLAQAEKGELTVDVESALPMLDEQVQGIETQLGKALGKQVHAATRVNVDLIAGCRIRVGDRVIDATVRGALTQFSQKLVSGAAEEGTL